MSQIIRRAPAIRRTLPADVSPLLSSGGDSFSFIASDDRAARDDMILLTGGLDITGYLTQRNIFAQHDPNTVIARCPDLYKTTNPPQLRGTGRFPKEGVCDECDRWRMMVREGLVNNLSIGFRILKITPPNREGIRIIEESDLCDISLVASPANPGCYITSRDIRRSQGDRARECLRSARDYLGMARNHARDLGDALNNQNDLTAAAYPHARCRDAIHGACRMLTEARDLDLPDGSPTDARKRLGDAWRAARAADAHHRDIGNQLEGAEGYDRANLRRSHKEMSRCLDRAHNAVEDVLDISRVTDADLGAFADNSGDGTLLKNDAGAYPAATGTPGAKSYQPALARYQQLDAELHYHHNDRWAAEHAAAVALAASRPRETNAINLAQHCDDTRRRLEAQCLRYSAYVRAGSR